MKLIGAIFTGLIFGLGLGLSGMTNPEKVVGFLDVLGDWDITLVFVIGGSIAVHMTTRRLALKRGIPEPGPISWKIDPALMTGAAMFGAGWALAGWCPGPAVASIATLSSDFLIFFAAMSAGTIGWQEVQNIQERRAARAAATLPPSSTGSAPAGGA